MYNLPPPSGCGHSGRPAGGGSPAPSDLQQAAVFAVPRKRGDPERGDLEGYFSVTSKFDSKVMLR